MNNRLTITLIIWDLPVESSLNLIGEITKRFPRHVYFKRCNVYAYLMPITHLLCHALRSLLYNLNLINLQIYITFYTISCHFMIKSIANNCDLFVEVPLIYLPLTTPRSRISAINYKIFVLSFSILFENGFTDSDKLLYEYSVGLRIRCYLFLNP